MSNERKYARTLGRTVRALRGAKTQKEVAKVAGLPVSTLSKIEQGRQVPRNETFAKIALGLGLAVAELEQHVAENTLSGFGDAGLDDAVGPLAQRRLAARFRRARGGVLDLTGVPRNAALRLASTLEKIESLRNYVASLELDVRNLAREFQELEPPS